MTIEDILLEVRKEALLLRIDAIKDELLAEADLLRSERKLPDIEASDREAAA